MECISRLQSCARATASGTGADARLSPLFYLALLFMLSFLSIPTIIKAQMKNSIPRNIKRCSWADGDDALMQEYHDKEWGFPSHNDRHLFEMLTLEGAQAGLSWITILRKRENYRAAFDNFDAARIARYDANKI